MNWVDFGVLVLNGDVEMLICSLWCKIGDVAFLDSFGEHKLIEKQPEG